MAEVSQPAVTRMRASSTGVVWSADRAITRSPGAARARTRRGSRPTSETQSVVSAGHSILARARVSEDSAGCTRMRSAPSTSISVVATPESRGSPDASTTTSSPSPPNRSASPARSGEGQGTPREGSGSIFRCLAPPTTTGAEDTSSRKPAGKSLSPDAGTPTTSITVRELIWIVEQ